MRRAPTYVDEYQPDSELICTTVPVCGAWMNEPHTGTVVQISSMSGWYSDNYVGARRIG